MSILLCIDPDLVIGFFNQAIKKELETTIIISNGIFQTLIWILIAYILVRYIQDLAKSLVDDYRAGMNPFN